MFKYASALGIANASGHKLILPRHEFLWRDFPNLSAVQRSKPAKNFSHQVNVHERGWASFDTQVLAHAQTYSCRHVQLHGYFQSFKYFAYLGDSLRQELTASDAYVKAARSFVDSRLQYHLSQLQLVERTLTASDVTPVGVHVRRSDMLELAQQEQGYTTAPKVYFNKAMRFVRNRLKTHCLFVVASDDPDWCKRNLHAADVVFTDDFDFSLYPRLHWDVLEMTILRQTQASILSTGSFSWWIGWLTNAHTTVYYPHFPREHSSLMGGFTREDYFPAHWIAIE